ncbi:M15 family metallopeptidase [Oerskovia paurometabola]|uniref:M15 family metallopeptidase n=1 Tax=Oerskovia paurometabola TaxID=162170 RepID=UPI0038141394
MATTYANGSVPPSLLAPLDGQPEASLRADAAAAWNRARADVWRRTGITLRVRGWNRTLDEQRRFFLERYEPRRTGGTDVRWYQGVRYVRVRGAAAAIPGTSNHGYGIAVDVEDYGNVGEFNYPRRVATFPILAEHGWTDTEGRGAIREPWHLVYDPARDQHRNTPTPTPAPVAPAPVPDIQEDDDMNTERLIQACYRKFFNREGTTQDVDGWLISAAIGKRTDAQIVEAFLKSTAEPGTVVAAFLESIGHAPNASQITEWTKDKANVETVRKNIAASPEARAKKG